MAAVAARMAAASRRAISDPAAAPAACTMPSSRGRCWASRCQQRLGGLGAQVGLEQLDPVGPARQGGRQLRLAGQQHQPAVGLLEQPGRDAAADPAGAAQHQIDARRPPAARRGRRAVRARRHRHRQHRLLPPVALPQRQPARRAAGRLGVGCPVPAVSVVLGQQGGQRPGPVGQVRSGQVQPAAVDAGLLRAHRADAGQQPDLWALGRRPRTGWPRQDSHQTRSPAARLAGQRLQQRGRGVQAGPAGAVQGAGPHRPVDRQRQRVQPVDAGRCRRCSARAAAAPATPGRPDRPGRHRGPTRWKAPPALTRTTRE